MLNKANLKEANLIGANLSGAELKDSEVTNTKFSSNSPGMTEELKQNLIQRRAIFQNSLEEPLILTPVHR
ncbi:pentapeptide repeat-containing protein [Okeania sp. SIO3I5]|uniref:pentapeptide repeat-containing protein n=1 Tax=Okeania sp. SIO3I5 TaxID=2607805 RepID=UPI00343F7863